MNHFSSQRILLAGSGTAGPVIPLLAVIEDVRRRVPNVEVRFLGTASGPERALVEAVRIPFSVFPAGKWRRYWSWKNISDVFVLLWAFLRACIFLIKWRPDVFFSAGGYIAPPIAYACWILRIPVLIHQQDVLPVLSNRLIAPIADAITVTFERSLQDFRKSVVYYTGNPVRADVADGSKNRFIAAHKLPQEGPALLVFGGGTGSSALNEYLVEALEELCAFTHVFHVTGVGKNVPVPSFSGPFTYTQSEFLHDMPDAYAWADVVVCRGGLSTMTELSTIGKPALVVPLPHSPQEANVAYMEERGAVLRMDESHLSSAEFCSKVKDMMFDTDLRSSLLLQQRSVFPKGATRSVADVLLTLV